MKKTNKMRILTLSLLVIATLSNGGCTYIINSAAKRVAETHVKKFNLYVNRVDPFVVCLENPKGICPINNSLENSSGSSFFSAPRSRIDPTAQRILSTNMSEPELALFDDEGGQKIQALQTSAGLAREVLNHPVQEQLNGLFSVVKGAIPPDVFLKSDDGPGERVFHTEFDVSSGKTTTEINITLAQFEEYQQKIEVATLMGGWDALHQEGRLLEAEQESDKARMKAYINHYFDAYFRDGKFFKATVDGGDLKKKIVEKLKNNVPGLTDDDYKDLAEKLFPNYNFDAGKTQYIFGKINDSGFVTRGGQKLAFPAVQASVTLGSSEIERSDINMVAVGSDLIRVLLHAIYDSELQLPAVSNATGITAPISPLVVNNPKNDADSDGTNVDDLEFARIETRAAQIEGVVSTGTGRIIRGISFLSLNNEAIATAIETAVGLAVRKQMEKVMWCWYECQFNEVDKELGNFVATTYGGQIELTISVSGLPTEDFGISGEAVRK